MRALVAPLHRGLALALTVGGDCLRDKPSTQQYVSHLLGAVVRELHVLAGWWPVSSHADSACPARNRSKQRCR